MDLLNMLYCQVGVDAPSVASLTRLVVTILKIAIPIILVILGILDLAKAVMANEEKDMKEAQKRLIKRIVYAIVVFFVISLVQLIFTTLARNDSDNTDVTSLDVPGQKSSISSCISCFTSSEKSCKE